MSIVINICFLELGNSFVVFFYKLFECQIYKLNSYTEWDKGFLIINVKFALNFTFVQYVCTNLKPQQKVQTHGIYCLQFEHVKAPCVCRNLINRANTV